MKQNTFYTTLGITTTASYDEVKKAFRKLAQIHHPDKNNDKTEGIFQQILEAYNTLSDPQKRETYDASISLGPNESIFFKEDKKSAEQSAQEHSASMLNHLRHMQNDDEIPDGGILNRMRSQSAQPSEEDNENQKGLFGRLFRKKETQDKESSGQNKKDKATYSGRRSSTSLRLFHVSVDALESLKECTREIVVEIRGQAEKLKVTIPALIEDKSVLQVRHLSPGDSRPRVFTVVVNIIPHEYVRRQGNDLYITVPITIGEAIKGADIEIPLVRAVIRVKFPPLNLPGKKMRLKGKGLVDSRGQQGDVFVEPMIIAPPVLSPVAQQAADAMDSQYIEPPRKNFPKTLG